jgi:hypothetical protein
MTKLFESAVEIVRSLMPETQDALARIVLQLVRENDLPIMAMSIEEASSFEESLAQADRGEFVDDERLSRREARTVRVRYTPRAFRELIAVSPTFRAPDR